MKIRLSLLMLIVLVASAAYGQQHAVLPQYVTNSPADGAFAVFDGASAATIVVDPADWPGVKRAAKSLSQDIGRVAGTEAKVAQGTKSKPGSIIVGTVGKSALIDKLVKEGKLDTSDIAGQWESYMLATTDDGSLVIAGADKRGTIYGVYDLSEKMGVSPWYYWADVPVAQADGIYVEPGRYVAPSPKVKYRGIFLNDEAPCLTSWVKNTFGTEYGGADFYEKVFELLLRLRANYLWPAMWGWAFYADDPANSDLADEMGIVMGTSHHEPMARNHQEWARHRGEYGVWDYASNQEVIDKFFREGVERIADKEDIITIGMRGDGDAPMGGKEGHDHEYVSEDERNMALMEKIFRNQRQIIADATGRAPEEHPQLWALYKEVQKYYDMGLRVPDDVIILLADDNWGNVRRLPNAEERKHPGGWGMYYHVDYVGAPRNSKWLNVTPIQGMWEQLSLTYDYGVDKLWVLNVGDLKPMEYPISLFLDMAWDPTRFDAANIKDHAVEFCAQQFGPEQAAEAARILNLYSKYNGRVTPEMLDCATYSLATGEWRDVRNDYLSLEAEALRQYASLPAEYRDAYFQLVLFPVQAMANLYDLYYSQAMNLALYEQGDPQCNLWADRAEAAFARDKQLQQQYNKEMAAGKWDGMMTQKHIGYTSWNDDFPADRMPKIKRMADADAARMGGYTVIGGNGVAVAEAEHFYSADAPQGYEWVVIPDLGRTLSGVELMPRTEAAEGARLSYKFRLPQELDSVAVIVVQKSTLPFARSEGHRFKIGFDGAEPALVNYNARLNEQPENQYTVFYPTVARRVIETRTSLALPASDTGEYVLTIEPIEPGAVFEKIVLDYGAYQPSYLHMQPSAKERSAK